MPMSSKCFFLFEIFDENIYYDWVLSSQMRATYHTHLVMLDIITCTIWRESKLIYL